MVSMLTLALAVLAPCAALAKTTILGPGKEGRHWIQFTNNLTWSYEQGDVSPISIFITNSNQDLLNGNFSIIEFQDASVEQFAVTNVTLKVGGGYRATFYDSKNTSNIVAVSDPFEVVEPGSAANNPLRSAIHPSATASSSTTRKPTSTQGGGAPLGTAPPDDSSSRLAVGSLVALVGAAVASLVL